MTITGYLAPEERLGDLLAELGQEGEVYDRLVLIEGPPVAAAWAQNIWVEVERHRFETIGEAARILRAMGRNWAHFPLAAHRRAALIAEKLPHVSAKPLVFPAPAPGAPLGSWSLIDANTLIAAPRCSSPFAHGEARFVEDRSGPPSRAYLKLWEALTLLGRHPGPGELCVDLGSSPGGWSWVLAELGARVISVDKAPLDPRLSDHPNIEARRMSAFALEPRAFGPVDWLVSDIICYPERLYRLIEDWLASGHARNIVCTVKFQGETEQAWVKRFQALPDGRLVHLHHNKHELTWMWPRQPASSA